MVCDELKKVFLEAFDGIAGRTGAYAQDFGHTEFPEDNGQEFRNHFLGFSFSAFQTVQFLLDNQPEDKWVVRNKDIVDQLSSEEWTSIIGELHFYSEARHLNRYWHTRDAVRVLLGNDQTVQRMLDWIHCIYSLGSDSAQDWFKIITEHEEASHFGHAASAQLAIHLCDLLPRAVGSECDCWDGLAIAAALERPNQDDAEWNSRCNRAFAQ